MRVLLLILFLTPLAAGCALLGDDDRDMVRFGIQTEEEYRDKRAELVVALEAAIGDASATEVSACRVLYVGKKACGGPVEYRVYSATDGDADAIQNLAEQITELDAMANEAFGLASTCDVPVPPTPVLAAGRCIASSLVQNAQ